MLSSVSYIERLQFIVELELTSVAWQILDQETQSPILLHSTR